MKYYFLIIGLIITVSFANSLQNSFVWDDYPLIVENPKINMPLKELPYVFTRPMWNASDNLESRQAYYRPIVSMLFILNYKAWGANPMGFHLINIIFHLLISIVLYRIGMLLFNDSLISLMAASFFAIHPIHNEPIGRAASAEVVFGLFFILAIYFFIKEKHYLSLIMYLLALLSKEPAVMLPFSLVILSSHKKGSKKANVATMPYIAVAGTYLIIRAMMTDFVFVDKASQPLLTRILTMAAAALDYIRLLIIPYPLSPFYPERWHTSVLDLKVIIAMLALILLFFIIFRMRKDKVMLFLLLSPFFMLFPVIFKVNTFVAGRDFMYIAERFLYVPAMVFSLFISAFAVSFFSSLKKGYLTSGWAVVIISFIFITISSNRMWRNEIVLFRTIIEKSHGVAFGHHSLGIAYYSAGRLTDSIQKYKDALKLKPDYPEAYNNLGMAYQDTGQLENAVTAYRAAMKIQPDFAVAHNNLGTVYLQNRLTSEAIYEFQTALKLQPDFIAARQNLEALKK